MGFFSLSKTPTFVSSPFVANNGSKLIPVRFDGVACEDDHLNIILQTNLSTIMFQIPTQENNT
jgi:hypothetical protein